MALTTSLLFFTLSIVFSSYALAFDDSEPSKPADGTPFSCIIGDSDKPTCCSFTNSGSDEGEGFYGKDRYYLNNPGTDPGHSKGVGHHSFTCSVTQSLTDSDSEGQGCNCVQAACTPDPNCSTSSAKKRLD